MLRLATPDDLSDILRMARAFHQSSTYHDVPFDEEYVSKSILHTLTQPETSVIILGGSSHPVGVIIGAVSECMFNGWRQTTELMFWVDPEARRSTVAKELKGAYDYWAKNIVRSQIDFMSLLEDENLPKIEKLYRRSGYTPVERHYMKVVA